MKYKTFKFLQTIKWIYRIAAGLVAFRILHSEPLTPEYLEIHGWIKEGEFWVEKNIKARDKIWIHFENHYYRVYHSEQRTFIALKSSLGWFQFYYAMLSTDELYEIAGV